MNQEPTQTRFINGMTPVLDSPRSMPSILIVCTGNVCRSPMAEGFLRAALERPPFQSPVIASAGIVGWAGSSAVPEAIAVAAERGIDISRHVARRLLRAHITAADLIVAMAVEHRDAIVGAVPEAGSRSFTLKELVRLLEALPPFPSSDTPRAELRERVATAADMRCQGFEGNPRDEDLVDPIGMSMETFRAVAWEIDEWCRRLVEGLFGKPPASTTRDRE
jgi:protein-tyrosine phosphatase